MRKIILWTLAIFIVCGLTALAVQLNIGTEGALPTGAIPVQTPVPGEAFYGWNGISFDTVVMPTPAPTSSPIPASTPVAGQAVTGWGAGTSSVSRESVQAPLPTATPTAGNAVTAWNGSAFTVTPIQAPLPTPTPTTNYVLRGWNGSAFIASQLDYSEIANPPSLDFDPAGTAAALITSSTSSPSDPCTGLQGNFWRKVDSGGAMVDLFQCDCEGADNATNCVWHSNVNPVDVPLVVTGGHLTFDISSLSAATPDLANDYLVFFDATDSLPKKALLNTVGGTPTATNVTCKDMRLDSVDTQNASTGMYTLHLTNGWDEVGAYYIDNVAAAGTTWTTYVPPDVAAAPAWYLNIISRSAGSAGDAYLTIVCAAIGTTEAADASPVTIAAAGAVAIGTGTNNTLSTFNCASNCDSTMPIAASDEIKCKVIRTSNNAADTISNTWYLKRVEFCYAHNIN